MIRSRFLGSGALSLIVACLAAVAILVACVGPGQPLPPFRGPVPVTIPHVVLVEECEHRILPGGQFAFVIPQGGVWNWEWQLTTATGVSWITQTPYPFNVGDTMRFSSNFPVRVTWAPSSQQGTPWYVVSDVTTPYPNPTKCE